VFLTEIDSRAKVRGSRDPLGLVPLWSYFGRQVVGNLTTVTTSVRGFTTLLLGYHFAKEVRERQGQEAETTLALFLKFEQLAGYCRYLVEDDGDFRGIERVTRNLGESTSVRLSDRSGDQILSNQRVYGLWGLYSSPARASGLLEREEPVLTPAAQSFVETTYLSRLSKEGFREGRVVVDLLRQPRPKVDLGGRHAALAKTLAGILTAECRGPEARFYREHLLLGGPDEATSGRQRQLAELMAHLPSENGFDRTELRALIKEAGRRGEAMAPLADRLQRIDQLEALLVPASAASSFLLARHGQTPASVAKEFQAAWGRRVKTVDPAAIRALRDDIAHALHDEGAGDRWGKLAEALAAGDCEAWIRLLMEQNAWVMGNRNDSSPWLRVKAGKLDVRIRYEAERLPSREDLPQQWRHNYFLDPLKALTVELGGV
jgi:hypothetical protein